VIQNAWRAEPVAPAEDWRWLSLPGWLDGDPRLCRGEVEARDELWVQPVNEPLSDGDLQRLRVFGLRLFPESSEIAEGSTLLHGVRGCRMMAITH
jgi:hypothetical protein